MTLRNKFLIIACLCLSVHAAYPEHDMFERPDDDFDLDSTYWTTCRGVVGILSKRAYGDTPTFPSCAMWTSQTGLTADQFAQGLVYGTAGPAVRINDASDNWYDCVGGNDGSTRLRRITAGVATNLVANSTGGQKAIDGDLIQLQVSGTTLTCKVYTGWSTTLQATLSTTDANFASGAIGLTTDFSYGRTLDNWVGGNVSSLPIPVPFAAGAGQYYASPTGAITGDGTMAAPYLLDVILSVQTLVPAGSTIWLRGGTYTPDYQIYKPTEVWSFTMNGTSTDRIKFEAFPGETAILDAAITCAGSDGGGGWNILHHTGNYLTFKGHFNNLFVTNSDTSCKVITRCGSNPGGTPLKGVRSLGDFVQMYGLVVHDTGQGIASQSGLEGGRFVGNLIFNNGWNAPDRLHGPGLYLQNEYSGTTKEFIHQITIRNYTFQMKAFSQSGSEAPNMKFEDSIFVAANGITKGAGLGDGIDIQASNVDDHTYLNNSFYTNRFTFNVDNVLANRLRFTGNIQDGNWDFNRTAAAVVTGNVFSHWSSNGGSTVYRIAFLDDPSWDTVGEAFAPIDLNAYYSARDLNNVFRQGITGGANTTYNFTTWQGTGADPSSTFYALSTIFPAWNTSASGSAVNYTKVYVNPEQPGSGMVAIYNWKNSSTVDVNVSTILTAGDPYEVIDLQCFNCGPVVTGTFGGTTVTFPMTLTAIQPISGTYDADPGLTCTAGSEGGSSSSAHGVPVIKHTETYFGSFLVRRRQLYRTVQLSTVNPFAAATQLKVESGPSATVLNFPTQTVACATAALCKFSIGTQMTGNTFYKLTYLTAGNATVSQSDAIRIGVN